MRQCILIFLAMGAMLPQSAWAQDPDPAAETAVPPIESVAPAPDVPILDEPGRAAPVEPAEVSILDAAHLSEVALTAIQRTTPSEWARLDPKRVPELMPSQIRVISVRQLVDFTNAQIAEITPDQIRAFSREQLKPLRARKGLLAKDAQEALDKRIAEIRFYVASEAINPGIRLVGDGYSQLVDIADESAATLDASGAFGTGLEIQTIDFYAAAIVRKGTQPSTLTSDDTRTFGRSLLTPETENFYAGLEVEWLQDDWWFLRKSSSVLVGPAGSVRAAFTTWNLQLTPEVVAQPADPNTPDSVETPARPAVFVDSTAVILAASLGAKVRYVVAQGDNYVDFSVFAYGTVRGVSLDPNRDERLNRRRTEDERVTATSFAEQALGTTDTLFYGAELGFAFRVNQVVIAALFPIMSGDVSGFSGFNFIPTLSLRAGAQLVDLEVNPDDL